MLSIWISLFWLVLLVGVHGLLELLRQRTVDPAPLGVASRVAWELKLDLALVLFALVVALYIDLVLGVAGLGGAARVCAQAAARGGAWARGIRGVLLSIDDAAQLARAAAGRSGGAMAPIDAQSRYGGWVGAWGIGGWLSIGLFAISLALILLSPLLTGHTAASAWSQLLAELHPWPTSPAATPAESTGG